MISALSTMIMTVSLWRVRAVHRPSRESLVESEVVLQNRDREGADAVVNFARYVASQGIEGTTAEYADPRRSGSRIPEPANPPLGDITQSAAPPQPAP